MPAALLDAIAAQAMIQAGLALYSLPLEFHALALRLKKEGVLGEQRTVVKWTQGGIATASAPITIPHFVWACEATDNFYPTV